MTDWLVTMFAENVFNALFTLVVYTTGFLLFKRRTVVISDLKPNTSSRSDDVARISLSERKLNDLRRGLEETLAYYFSLIGFGIGFLICFSIFFASLWSLGLPTKVPLPVDVWGSEVDRSYFLIFGFMLFSVACSRIVYLTSTKFRMFERFVVGREISLSKFNSALFGFLPWFLPVFTFATACMIQDGELNPLAYAVLLIGVVAGCVYAIRRVIRYKPELITPIPRAEKSSTKQSV